MKVIIFVFIFFTSSDARRRQTINANVESRIPESDSKQSLAMSLLSVNPVTRRQVSMDRGIPLGASPSMERRVSVGRRNLLREGLALGAWLSLYPVKGAFADELEDRATLTEIRELLPKLREIVPKSQERLDAEKRLDSLDENDIEAESQIKESADVMEENNKAESSLKESLMDKVDPTAKSKLQEDNKAESSLKEIPEPMKSEPVEKVDLTAKSKLQEDNKAESSLKESLEPMTSESMDKADLVAKSKLQENLGAVKQEPIVDTDQKTEYKRSELAEALESISSDATGLKEKASIPDSVEATDSESNDLLVLKTRLAKLGGSIADPEGASKQLAVESQKFFESLQSMEKIGIPDAGVLGTVGSGALGGAIVALGTLALFSKDDEQEKGSTPSNGNAEQPVKIENELSVPLGGTRARQGLSDKYTRPGQESNLGATAAKTSETLPGTYAYYRMKQMQSEKTKQVPNHGATVVEASRPLPSKAIAKPLNGHASETHDYLNHRRNSRPGSDENRDPDVSKNPSQKTKVAEESEPLPGTYAYYMKHQRKA